ncbi:MAG: hypothetical protein IJS08_10800 [Victivallales bacterium]|nr:hypothetical protein [Victivallales bacterium]
MPSVKETLRNKNIALGGWCQIGHPAVAEIQAQSGMQWLALDCEHGEASEADIGDFCRATIGGGAEPFVRVRANETLDIRRALDLGATGVIVPLVNNASDAKRAVAAAKYPPKGIRGFAFQRGNCWGRDFDAYAATDDTRCVIVMIESREAVENIAAILDVEGVDGVFIGPYDMSGSYGIVGQTSSPIIVEACAKVAQACLKHGKAAGQHIVTPTPENIAAAKRQGYTFIALGMDTYFLANGVRTALEMFNG